MKRYFYLLFLGFFLVSCSLKDKWVKREIEKGSKETEKAYFMGYRIGRISKSQIKDKKDQKIFLLGLHHGVAGKNPLIEPLQKQSKKSSPEERKKNMEQGLKFLKENKSKTGVEETSSGLQYKILKKGQGKSPSGEDKVEVHYRGTLIDGTEFDSSYKRNQTITFPLNGVIKGWTEGLQLMKEGAKYEFYIPSELAYGSQGSVGAIPPNSVLIFEVELIKVK